MFASEFRQRRLALGWDLAECASAMGRDLATVAAWELGHDRIPDGAQIRAAFEEAERRRAGSQDGER